MHTHIKKYPAAFEKHKVYLIFSWHEEFFKMD